jgi:hypothetical protein
MFRSMVVRSPCTRFVRSVQKAMWVSLRLQFSHRMSVDGHDSHNTAGLSVVKAIPGRVEGKFSVEKQNCTRYLPDA